MILSNLNGIVDIIIIILRVTNNIISLEQKTIKFVLIISNFKLKILTYLKQSLLLLNQHIYVTPPQ